MMSAKMSLLDLLEVKLILKKCYDVITYVYDVTNKFLLYDSSYFVNVVMSLKFESHDHIIREVIITSML